MTNKITHINKQDLPNPFAKPVTQPKMAPAPGPASQSWAPEMKTITIKATTITPRQGPDTPLTPGDRQPMTMGMPMEQADRPVRSQIDTQAAVDLFAGFGEAMATVIGELLNGLMLSSDLFGAFLSGFGSGFSLNTQRPKVKQKMPFAEYAIAAKLSDVITRKLEESIYIVTPIAYTQDNKYIFGVPVKMYKVCEKILASTGIEYERIK